MAPTSPPAVGRTARARAVRLGLGALLLAACQPADDAPAGLRTVHLEPVLWSRDAPSAGPSSTITSRPQLIPGQLGEFVGCRQVRPAVGEFAPAMTPTDPADAAFAGWIARGIDFPPHLHWNLVLDVEGPFEGTLDLLYDLPGAEFDHAAGPSHLFGRGLVERTWVDEQGRQRTKLNYREPDDGRLWTEGIGALAVRLPETERGLRLIRISAKGVGLDQQPDAVEGGSGPQDAGLWSSVIEDDDPALVRYEARRSYPAFASSPLVSGYVAGGEPRLHVSVALPPGHDGEGPVTFEVRARPRSTMDPAGDGEALASLEVAETLATRAWAPLAVDLPGGPGEAWELIFDVRWSGPQRAVAGLWGSPAIDYKRGEERPSALVITADTLRADHFKAHRKAHGLGELEGLDTPHLDALAARGVVFADALSASNTTSPSHVSLFTSLPVRDHGVLLNGYRLGAGHVTLAELFQAGGWTTLHSVAARHLNPGLSSLGQGLDYSLEMPAVRASQLDASPGEGGAQRMVLHSSAAYGVPRVLDTLDELDGRPFYLWLHSFDPHTPYSPPDDLVAELGLRDAEQARPLLESLAARHRERPGDLQNFLGENPALSFLEGMRSAEYARSLYAASVTYMDRCLGDLFDGLDQRGRLDDTLIVFTSDHGENLGERDAWFSHLGIYGATVRVPLLFAGPGVARGQVVRAGVSTLDVYPTLAEWFGLEAPDYIAGRSLAATLRDPQGAPPAPLRRWFQHAGQSQVGFVDGDELFILTTRAQKASSLGGLREAGEAELLRATMRLEEPEPVLEDDAGALEAYVTAANAWLEDRQLDIQANSAPLDSSERKVLEALGYKD